jgi:hypothetical protein
MCHRFYAGRSLRTHKRKCAAEHPDHRGPEGLWSEPSHIPAEVKDLMNEETSALLAEVLWEEVGQYRHASQTLSVPFACRAEWRMAFQLPNHLWQEGYIEDSIKLHYMMIQMFAAPMPLAVRRGADDEEGQPSEQQGSVTKMVQSRLRRVFTGDWRGLWDEAQADMSTEQRVRTEEEQEAAKIRRARHEVLTGHLRDGHRTLMQPGMISLADKHVQEQMHALHEFEEDPKSMPQPPAGLEVEE